ncbi:hypothetical protein F0562_011043 [Nyssa sinensis]|uniref:Sugar phosphate transporter domain-containing protein n=1 Tax=Nyssa sinensis TaxID=561372 RepID=A0A5J5A2E2_9ASTE|nr:hypothetical protein F0562_011043 [Nyssa sinensis]
MACSAKQSYATATLSDHFQQQCPAPKPPLSSIPFKLALKKTNKSNLLPQKPPCISFERVAHTIRHVAETVSMSQVAASFTHIIKSSEPAFNVLDSSFVLGETFPMSVYLSLVPIIGGCALAAVTELNFNMTVIENLFIKGYLPILSDNVHSLDVKVSRVKDDDIPTIASFFMGLPNLMTLNITYNPKSRSFLDEDKFNKQLRIQGSDFNKQYQRSQNLLPIHQLKEVQIELRGDKNELGLLKYLLSHAKSLEKMTFFIQYLVFTCFQRWVYKN